MTPLLAKPPSPFQSADFPTTSVRLPASSNSMSSVRPDVCDTQTSARDRAGYFQEQGECKSPGKGLTHGVLLLLPQSSSPRPHRARSSPLPLARARHGTVATSDGREPKLKPQTCHRPTQWLLSRRRKMLRDATTSSPIERAAPESRGGRIERKCLPGTRPRIPA